jgi:uncharacterized membrane protein (DUF485 family)
MLHKPAASSGPDPAFLFKRKLGVWMFLIYGAIYTGFVIVNLVKPAAMEKILFAGLNLAVVYGMGLIVFALFLALIYNRACGRKEKSMKSAAGPGGRI